MDSRASENDSESGKPRKMASVLTFFIPGLGQRYSISEIVSYLQWLSG